MTTTGKLFRSYAETIIAKHGFGSNKMVQSWHVPFVESHKDEVAHLINDFAEGSEESKRGVALMNELWDRQEFLLNNGYLRRYQPEYMGWKGKRRVVRHGSVYIGLTEKGWAVANRYLEASI